MPEPDAGIRSVAVAIAIRVIDDQMRSLPPDASARQQYEKRKAVTDKYQYGLFDDLNLTLRDTCNKIIHSDVMEPHTKEGDEVHELDIECLHGDGERAIDWHHLNGYVRLSGTDRGKEWYVLLDVEAFVVGAYEILRLD